MHSPATAQTLPDFARCCKPATAQIAPSPKAPTRGRQADLVGQLAGGGDWAAPGVGDAARGATPTGAGRARRAQGPAAAAGRGAAPARRTSPAQQIPRPPASYRWHRWPRPLGPVQSDRVALPARRTRGRPGRVSAPHPGGGKIGPASMSLMQMGLLVIEAARCGPTGHPAPAPSAITVPLWRKAGANADTATLAACALDSGAAAIQGAGTVHDLGAIEGFGAGVVDADLGRLAVDPAAATVVGIVDSVGAGAVAANAIAETGRRDAAVAVGAGIAGVEPAGVPGRAACAGGAPGVLAVGQRRARASVDPTGRGRAEAPWRARLAAATAMHRIAIDVRAGSVAAGASASVGEAARPLVVPGCASIEGFTSATRARVATRTDDAAATAVARIVQRGTGAVAAVAPRSRPPAVPPQAELVAGGTGAADPAAEGVEAPLAGWTLDAGAILDHAAVDEALAVRAGSRRQRRWSRCHRSWLGRSRCRSAHGRLQRGRCPHLRPSAGKRSGRRARCSRPPCRCRRATPRRGHRRCHPVPAGGGRRRTRRCPVADLSRSCEPLPT